MEIILFYDVYEYENGDGFYPYPENSNSLTEISITFVKKNNNWHQLTSHSIMGFDGLGEGVLDKLEPDAKIGTKIFNNYGKLLFKKDPI